MNHTLPSDVTSMPESVTLNVDAGGGAFPPGALMDHTAAALALDRLAVNLHVAGGHLVGPGHEFVRRALVSAGDAAGDLSALHRSAARAQQAGDYVRDLLGPDALAAADPL